MYYFPAKKGTLHVGRLIHFSPGVAEIGDAMTPDIINWRGLDQQSRLTSGYDFSESSIYLLYHAGGFLSLSLFFAQFDNLRRFSHVPKAVFFVFYEFSS